MSTPQSRFLKALEESQGIAPESVEQERPSRFVSVLEENPRFSTRERPRFVGALKSLLSGVKEGFLSPLTVFGREGEELELQTTSEKAANALGEFIGFGIGFVPFAKGAGLALKGVGLANGLKTAKVIERTTRSGKVVETYPLYDFVRFTIGGGAQAAGMSEEIEDLPTNVAAGVALGGVVDGFFLLRALRHRVPNTGRIQDTGSPLPDVPVDPEQLGRERIVVPNDGDSAGEVLTKVGGLRADLSPEQVIADLTIDHRPAAVLRNIENPTEVANQYLVKNPDARVVLRKTRRFGKATNDLLIHSPAPDTPELTPTQIKQWQTHGTFEGLEVTYRSRDYEATGKVFGDRIQIRDPLRPHVKFAALRSDTNIPSLPRIYSPEVIRKQRLVQAVELSQGEVGFVVPTSRGVRAGVVDTAGFEEASSLDEFAARFRQEFEQLEVGSIEEGVRTIAQRRGIPGLLLKNEDITSRVYIFDQSRIVSSRETAGLGSPYNEASILNTPQGDEIIESFVPSWKNSLREPLISRGFSEKEVNEILEDHVRSMGQRLEDSLDGEFKAAVNASRIQFTDGCI